MIRRPELLRTVQSAIRRSPVTILFGPRQCGKTTLSRMVGRKTRTTYFDLENPVNEVRLREPMTTLERLRGLVVIDEVQRRPELFPILRVLADRRPLPARFLILGSVAPDLLRQSSETLAGRVEFVEMAGFGLEEAKPAEWGQLCWRGRVPPPFLARRDDDARAWQHNFIQTFVERDLPQLGSHVPSTALRRLWMMLAHSHAQVWEASDIARSLAESYQTVKRHRDLLTGALVVRQLQPWLENTAKRQVKSPKIYVRDSGLLHALLNVPSMEALEGHPKLGASWEGFAIEEILRYAGERNAYFWATQAGAELDLLLFLGGRRYGVEIKFADAPGTTKSMRIAIEDLKLHHLFVVYPGSERYDLDRNITVIPLPAVKDALAFRN